MQEEVILEIPEQNDEVPEWQPPVLKKVEVQKNQQSYADVFFMQYVICIILLTIIFSIKLWDEQSFQNAVNQFEAYTHMPSEPWILSSIEWVKQLWN